MLSLPLTRFNSNFYLNRNPQVDLQASERVYRIGQTKDVRIFRLITEFTVEEVILKRAMKKIEMVNNIIEKGSFNHSGQSEIDVPKEATQLIDIIKYGLHKIISNTVEEEGEEEAISAEDEMLQENIEDIMSKAKCVSINEIAEQAIDSSLHHFEADAELDSSVTSEATIVPSTEDEETLKNLIRKSNEKMLLNDASDAEQLTKKVVRLRHKEVVQDSEEKAKAEAESKLQKKLKKWAKNNYTSMSISFPQQEIAMSVPNDEEISDSKFIFKKKKRTEAKKKNPLHLIFFIKKNFRGSAGNTKP